MEALRPRGLGVEAVCREFVVLRGIAIPPYSYLGCTRASNIIGIYMAGVWCLGRVSSPKICMGSTNKNSEAGRDEKC